MDLFHVSTPGRRIIPEEISIAEIASSLIAELREKKKVNSLLCCLGQTDFHEASHLKVISDRAEFNPS